MRWSLGLNVAALVLLAALPTAQAWWCTGHMTIAEIARQNLKSSILTTVQGHFANFHKLGPWPKVTDLTEAGCWADDIKSNNRAMALWHFLNIPYNPSNYPANLPAQVENVESVIPQQYDAMQHWKHPNEWELTFALANLVHFYGDIHQPLHVTDFVSHEFPNGDKGGNLFMVNFQGRSQDLHGIWDSICGQYLSDPTRPLNGSSRAFIENLAQEFQQNFTFSSEETSVWNSTKMAQESYQFAVAFSYDGGKLKPGDTLSSAYVKQCYQAAGKRVTLAGLRLASELNYIFRDSNSVPKAKDIHDRIVKGRKEVQQMALEKYEEIAAFARAHPAK